MSNQRNAGCANPGAHLDEKPNLMQVGHLRFARYAEPVSSIDHDNPRWAWYGGEPCSEAEIIRRANALIKNRLVMEPQS